MTYKLKWRDLLIVVRSEDYQLLKIGCNPLRERDLHLEMKRFNVKITKLFFNNCDVNIYIKFK